MTRGFARQAPCEPRDFQDESRVKSCPLCAAKFGIATWRRHCRWCGGVVCDDCSKHRKRFVEGGEKMRVCNACIRAFLTFSTAHVTPQPTPVPTPMTSPGETPHARPQAAAAAPAQALQLPHASQATALDAETSAIGSAAPASGLASYSTTNLPLSAAKATPTLARSAASFEGPAVEANSRTASHHASSSGGNLSTLLHCACRTCRMVRELRRCAVDGMRGNARKVASAMGFVGVCAYVSFWLVLFWAAWTLVASRAVLRRLESWRWMWHNLRKTFSGGHGWYADLTEGSGLLMLLGAHVAAVFLVFYADSADWRRLALTVVLTVLAALLVSYEAAAAVVTSIVVVPTLIHLVAAANAAAT